MLLGIFLGRKLISKLKHVIILKVGLIILFQKCVSFTYSHLLPHICKNILFIYTIPILEETALKSLLFLYFKTC